jgi:hypothetical protein
MKMNRYRYFIVGARKSNPEDATAIWRVDDDLRTVLRRDNFAMESQTHGGSVAYSRITCDSDDAYTEIDRDLANKICKSWGVYTQEKP